MTVVTLNLDLIVNIVVLTIGHGLPEGNPPRMLPQSLYPYRETLQGKLGERILVLGVELPVTLAVGQARKNSSNI